MKKLFLLPLIILTTSTIFADEISIEQRQRAAMVLDISLQNNAKIFHEYSRIESRVNQLNEFPNPRLLLKICTAVGAMQAANRASYLNGVYNALEFDIAKVIGKENFKQVRQLISDSDEGISNSAYWIRETYCEAQGKDLEKLKENLLSIESTARKVQQILAKEMKANHEALLEQLANREQQKFIQQLKDN